MARVGITLGSAAAGAVIGSIVPGVGTLLGAQIGATIGTAVAMLAVPEKVEGPRLGESQFSASAYGNAIPVVAGRAMVAGQVIWADRMREHRSRKRQGKGGPRVTTYTYTRSVAVGVCEWLLEPSNPRVLKIFLDDKLVYDSTGASEVVQVPGFTFRWYPGSETQEPDPLIASILGDDAPAFRDLAYAVFPDLALDPFGQRLPNFRFEVASETVAAFPDVNSVPPAVPVYASNPSNKTYHLPWACNVAVDYARGRIYEGRSRASGGTGSANDELIRVYDLATMETIAEYPMGDMLAHLFPAGVAPTTFSVGAGLIHLGIDGYLYTCGGSSNRVPLWKIDVDAWRGVGVFGPPEGASFGLGGDTGWVVYAPMQINSVRVGSRILVVVQGSWSATLTIDAETMDYVWGAGDAAVSPPIFPINLGIGPITFPVLLIRGAERGDGSDLWYVRARDGTAPYRLEIGRVTYTAAAADLGSGVAAGITTQNMGDVLATDIDAGATYCAIQSGYYDETDGSLVLTIAAGGGPVSGWARFAAFKWSPSAGVVWIRRDLPLAVAHDARGEQRRVLGAAWGLGGNFVLEGATGAPVVSVAGASFKSLAWLDERIAQIGYRSAGSGVREIAKRFLLRDSAPALTVGEIVAALCERAGMAPGDIDVSGLSDEVAGYKLARPMAARDALGVLATAWLFDAAAIDDVLVFVKRGGAVVQAIPYGDLVREGDAARLVLEEPRADDQSLPREVIVNHEDITRQYETGAQGSRAALEPTATVASRGVMILELPVPLAPADAKAVALRVRLAAWRGRTPLAFSVGPKYARLAPTNIVTVGTRDGATIRARILRIDEGANFVRRIEAVTDDAADYAATAEADGGSGWVAPTIPGPYAARLILPDLPLIDDADDLGGEGLREYVIAGAYDAARWQGIRVHRSPDGAEWTELGAILSAAAWGAVVSLPAAPRSCWVFDRTGEIVVRMTAGEPDGATELECLNGANLGALVNPDGSAELFRWGAATNEGGGLFRLGLLLRGVRGTEDLVASRVPGALFVILEDDEERLAIEDDTTAAAATRFFRPVTVYETIDTATASAMKSARGRAERPYSPVAAAATRDGSGNIAMTWTRRTRIRGEWRDGTGDVPLGEASESYAVDILAGAPARWAPAYAASSTLGSGYGVALAFDGETASFPWASASGSSAWVSVTYAEAVALGGYAIQARNDGFTNQSPAAWTFEGWDGAAWVVLDTQSGQTGWTLAQWRAFAIAADKIAPYAAYRWNFTAHNGGGLIAVEQFRLTMSGGTGPNVARVDEAAARTITSTTPTATYSAADQTSDFGVLQSRVLVRIYQVSATVGRGAAAEAVL